MNAGTMNSSSGLGSMVRMTHTTSGTVLAHELGHFTQNLHTFGSQPAIVADAAKIIKDYLEGSDQPPEDGLLALDGDESWVTDTPADGGTAIFADAGLSECGTNGRVDIKVHFSDDYAAKWKRTAPIRLTT
jgi:hypothetical protein